MTHDSGPAADVDNERLIEVYNQWFEIEPVTTREQLEEAQRIRFQVYVIEHPFENPDDHPSGLETDAFDDHSGHCLLRHKPTGAYAGTVRLVLPVADAPLSSLPIQGACDDPGMKDPALFPLLRTGEISRFSISKQFRRRKTDTMYPDALDERIGQPPIPGDMRRVIPHMTLGLMEALVRMSIDNEITHLCAVMERQLLRLLGRMGIYFTPVGPMIEHHGSRQPCSRRLLELLAQVRQEREDVWEVMTAEGAHIEALQQLEAKLLPN